MKQDDALRLAPSTPRQRKVWRTIFPFLALGALLFVVALLLPTLAGPHAQQHANEVVSVSKLRRINTLQSDCASAHPTKGFACELPPLKSLSALKDTDYDSEHFLVSGVQYGYKFAVASCQADPAQRMIHYQLTAVPVDPGKSGFRAFCTDDSGVIWSDEDGSASNCLASRRAFDR